MKKLRLLLLSSLLLLGLFTLQVRAEDSASAYEDHLRSQQVFVEIYNTGPATIAANAPVILDPNGTQGSTLGGRVLTTTTTDSVFVFGVADESISSGEMGRVCVRGPHKIQVNSSERSVFPSGAILATSTTQGQAAPYSTADGTRGGQLGWLLTTTVSSDTGDTNVYWMWVNPRVHR